MNPHYDVLDDERRALLPLLACVRELGFYLAGGTALALHLGHRDSIDFDFFRTEAIDDTGALFASLTDSLAPHALVRTQDERNTLGVLVDGSIRLSFMTFPYPLEKPLVETEHLSLASIEDIGCMKLNAITGRGAWKDYVDLYFITNVLPLATLVGHLRAKMPDLDPLLALKSLVYFDDLTNEPIMYKIRPVDRDTIEAALIERVKEVSR